MTRTRKVPLPVASDGSTEHLVQSYVESMRKRFGEEGAFVLPSDAPRHMSPEDVIPTRIPSLDFALGIGGIPRGRIIEIYGPEMSGKTSLAIQIAASFHKQNPTGIVQFIDAEHALDVAYAERVGIDINRMPISQPDDGEQALQMAEHAIQSGAGLVIIDSVAALVPRAEVEGNMGDFHMGLQARLMSQGLRKLTAVAHKHNATVIFINQIRMKIGVVYGNPETTTGGNALKFYASVRMEVRKGKTIENGPAGSGGSSSPIGQEVTIKINKNKCAPPFRIVQTHLIFGEGFDILRSLVETAVYRGILKQSGGWIQYGEHKWHGVKSLIEELQSNEELFQKINHAIQYRNAQ